jgi:geranylgeranyl transferase type-1 subunit beta
MQLSDGSFRCVADDGESDVRFVYCAAAICALLNCNRTSHSDSGGRVRNIHDYINVQRAVSYVIRCVGYDGGIGLGPGTL